MSKRVDKKAEWKLLPDIWPEECPECGNDVEIYTHREDLSIAYEEEKVRCADPECPAKGVIEVGTDYAYGVWDESS